MRILLYTKYYVCIAVICLFNAGFVSCKPAKNEINQREEVIYRLPDTTVAEKPESNGTREPFRGMLGINGFEWDILDANRRIGGDGANAVKSFGGFRHYLDWGRMETVKDSYAFQPTLSGSWYYDSMYEWFQKNDIDVLACIKTIPDWLMSTYPADKRDNENAPLPYGQDKLAPASYIQFGKLAFQFAARYGNNKNVDEKLVRITLNLTGSQM